MKNKKISKQVYVRGKNVVWKERRKSRRFRMSSESHLRRIAERNVPAAREGGRHPEGAGWTGRFPEARVDKRRARCG